MDLEFKPRPESAFTRLAAWTSEAGRKARSDPSAWSLIGANVFAAATAIGTGMSALELLLLYWAQSVFICLCGSVRITLMRRPRRKRDFHDDAPPGPEPLRARLEASLTYLSFWMVLHFMPVFVWLMQPKAPQAFTVHWPVFMLCLAVFAAHHVYSLVHNLRADAAGTSGDRDTMFIIPFFRIFPMGIISAVAVAAGAHGGPYVFTMVFYAAMKSVADLACHRLEHQLLQARPRDDKPYIS